MLRPRSRWFAAAGVISTAAFAGCAQDAPPVSMGGNADHVSIRYYGDVSATLPLAQRHCLQYERTPHMRDAFPEENLVTYACIR